ncbi:LOW QUALITY PROTEIN: hypothetical protein YC2023_076497 [Brassica napus]
MWLGKSVLSRALTLPKKQFESLSVSSLIRKKQSTHNSLYIIIYIVLTSIIKNISYPKSVVEIQESIPTDTKAATTSLPAHSSYETKTLSTTPRLRGGNAPKNVSLCLSNSSNRRPDIRHSTFESLRLGLSSQSIASGFLRLWDSLNFKKDREFVGITVLFLDEKINSVIHGFTPVGHANHYMPSLKADSIVKVDRFEVLQVIANTNLEIGKHSIFGSSKQDYNQANSSGMTYQQLKLVISQQLIPYFPYLKKSTVFLIYFFIYATLASVMDSSLPRIALTMVSGKKKILLLKKDRDNPVNSSFQAEQQMEANFFGSSSTSRQNQKIDIFSLACLTSDADETQHTRQTNLMQVFLLDAIGASRRSDRRGRGD